MTEESNRQGREIEAISQLIMLVTMNFFSFMLILLNRILSWEAWMILVIIAGCAICDVLHVLHKGSAKTRTYIYGIFMIFETFYYAVNIDTVYDCSAMIVIMVFLFAVTGEKILLAAGVAGGCLGMVEHLVRVQGNGGLTFDVSHVIRTGWQFVLVFLAAFLAERIVKIWRSTTHYYQSRIAQVEEENRRANNFLANVSHEIRTPVNAVMGLSTVLEKENLSEQVRNNVESIAEAGHRVSEQISDILDYTEIDMGKLSVNKESYMIDSLVNDLLEQLTFMENYGLDLVVDMEAMIPAELKGDGTKIRKILWHLISNGYKYTKEGGVNVHIYSVEREYGINLCLEVMDTGCGMTEDEIDHIYDKFYQADTGRSRTVGGLGLGIPIVNGFTRAMGGVLNIESIPEEGTLVRVSIPQEVVDAAPCISVKDREHCVIVGFLGFMTTGHPKIREFYMEMIAHLVLGLGVSFNRVQSRDELEKIMATKTVTHLFVGTGEYKQNKAYIDELASKMNVAVVADPGFAEKTREGIYVMAKPFYGVQVANFLNRVFSERDMLGKERLTCPGLQVLVVDDEPMNLLVARGIFKTYGMVVTTVAGGAEAIELCHTRDFDIIFMDHMMPGMDGVEAMKRLRQNALKQKKELCIVALTANAISSAKEMFLSVGFDGFVPKPIEVAELERVLKRVLPKAAIVYEKVSTEDSKPQENIVSDVEEQPEHRDRRSFEDIRAGLEADGLDTELGLKYCEGDPELYRDVLAEYVKNRKQKQEEIQELYDAASWKDYCIRVHAIKSTSKIIGMPDLSEQARVLEELSRQEEEAGIRELHPDFIKLYGDVMEKIRRQLDDGEDGQTQETEPDADDEILEFLPQDEMPEGSGI